MEIAVVLAAITVAGGAIVALVFRRIQERYKTHE
jgi:hypothetical protein